MKVRHDWWRWFFNDIYLITDARSVCDPKLTGREADLLENALRLQKDDRILDLCGGHGRHALELARRGYRDVTVLDFSEHLLKIGRREAKRAGLPIKFVRADARFSKLKTADYSVVFIMANSFGYFQKEKDNLRVLRESRRLLKESGRLLLDLADPAHVRNRLKPFSWHEADRDVIVCRQRELKGDVMKAREVVVSKKKGLLRDGRYAERIYDKGKITRLLKDTGFKDLSVKDRTSLHDKKKDYGLLSSRMIVTAVKP